MSKKFRKSAKEIERLQNLYQLDSNQPKESIKPVSKLASDNSTPDSVHIIGNRQTVKHAVIKQDLVFVSILAVIMMALLFGLNYLTATTGFSGWLAGLAGQIF